MRIVQMALYIIVRPADYFRTMPRQGSLAEPLAFSIVLSIVATLISALIGAALNQNEGMSVLDLLILAPGMIVTASIIGAGILFLLWKVLGSQQGYGVAFRCSVATLAITPVTAIVAFIPMIGLWVNVVWTMYLLVIASVEVHGISKRKAIIAFTIFGAVIAASSALMTAGQVMLEEQLRELGVSPAEFTAMDKDQQQKTLSDIQRNMENRP